MNLYFDTSALIKRYIVEKGSDKVDSLMDNAERIIVSVITEIETCLTFKRLVTEKAISENDYQTALSEFEYDYEYYIPVNFDKNISEQAKLIIQRYQLKTLDSIQLGTALLLKDEIDYFVVSDDKLIRSGQGEGLKIINPLK